MAHFRVIVATSACVTFFAIFGACVYQPGPASKSVPLPPQVIVEEPRPPAHRPVGPAPAAPPTAAAPSASDEAISAKLEQVDDALRWLRDTTLTKRGAQH